MEPNTTTAWVDPSGYPGLEGLQGHCATIRAELDGVLAARAPWTRFGKDDSVYALRERSAEEIRQLLRSRETLPGADPSYKLFGLVRERQPLPGAVLCPGTARLLDQVPQVVHAAFACMEPGYHIEPHRGGDPRINKCHLGLVVPEGDCGITAGGATRQWQIGGVLIFDDSSLHEAWNRTPDRRYILLIDLLKAGVAL